MTNLKLALQNIRHQIISNGAKNINKKYRKESRSGNRE